MNKSLTVAGIIAAMAMATPAIAFPGGSNDHQMGQQSMAEALDLSKTQQQQFKQIHSKARPTMQKLHDAMQDNRESLHKLNPDSEGYMLQVNRLAAEQGSLVEQMVKARAALHADIAAILTPEQFAIAEKLKDERKAKREKHRRDGRGDGLKGHRGPDFEGDDA